MNKDRLLKFINENESWAKVKSPESDIMTNIKARAVKKQIQMAKMLTIFKGISASLAVLVVALLIGIFARQNDNTIVLIYPAAGNEDKVILSIGQQDLEMKYDKTQNIYVRKVEGSEQALSNMKIRVKTLDDEINRSTIDYIAQQRIQDQNEYSSESLVVVDDARTANNQDNELDGINIPGLDENLLASAKLTF